MHRTRPSRLVIGFEGHRILIEDLVAAIRDKRPPMFPGPEAKNAVRLILAAYESAGTGIHSTLGAVA